MAFKTGVLMILIFLQLQRLVKATLDISKFFLPKRFVSKAHKSSVSRTTQDLIKKYHPIDLGKGFPDFNPPDSLKEAIINTANSNNFQLSQYTALYGHPRLLNALSTFYTNRLNRTLNPASEILVTVGGIQALCFALQAHTSPGDEWIVFEPFYDYYPSLIKAAQGVVKYIRLKPESTRGKVYANDFVFDKQELASLFNEKTKGIIINTPHNPLGKVFTRDELEYIARLAQRWDALVLADEVYEFFVFDDNEHTSIATLSGMFERTITIGSGGKSFSATGIRVGWAYGGAEIMKNVIAVQTIINLPNATINQEVIAIEFENEIENFGTEKSYLTNFKIEVQQKRDSLVEAFNIAGMVPIIPQGGYFVVANWTTLNDRIQISTECDIPRDVGFVNWMIKNLKIQGIPMTGFYSEDNREIGEEVLRFCMVKKEETLAQALDNVKSWSLSSTNEDN